MSSLQQFTIQMVKMIEETNPQEFDSEDFSQLLEEFEFKSAKRGQVLHGEILAIQEDAILLDVGLKRDAVVPARELAQTDKELLRRLSVGDHVPVFVIDPGGGNEDLQVSLQKALEGQNWEDARQDMANETMLEVEVVGQNRGGLLVKYRQIEGFVPNSHIPGLQRDMDPVQARTVKSGWVGKRMSVKTIEVDPQRRKLVYSAVHAQEERRQQRMTELKQQEGQVVTGEVVNVVDFGVFVDLDGVDGLIHVSELDWGRVEKPEELYKPGDRVDVRILEVNIDRERVTLSRKSLLPNPWKILEERYKPGQVIECEIVQVMDFGAFVQLPQGVQGLIPKNELGYTHTDVPQETVKAGDRVIARILSIEADEGRMALSMRQVPREKQIDWLLSGAGSGLSEADAGNSQAEEEDAITNKADQSQDDTENQALSGIEPESFDTDSVGGADEKDSSGEEEPQ